MTLDHGAAVRALTRYVAVPETGEPRRPQLRQRISARFPRFGDVQGWPERVYMRELDMGNDRDRFNEVWASRLYEGRMVDQFDHRAKAYESGTGEDRGVAAPAVRRPWKGNHATVVRRRRRDPADLRPDAKYRMGSAASRAPRMSGPSSRP